MRAQERDDRPAKQQPPQAVSSTGRPAAGIPMSAQSLIALQRSAGNAAVVQMLRQAGAAPEEHRHGAGCGHEPPQQGPVQRSAVPDVLRSGGSPLDSAVRTDMEARLGADFSDVRIHNDSAARASAAEIGARAYTSGSHVVIGQGGSDRHTLAHELTHVIQQRQGPVAGTDNGSGLAVSDPGDRFEREAESNARRALAGPSAGASAGAQAQTQGGRSAAAGADQAPSVQRAIGLEIEIDRPVVNHDGSDVSSGTSSGFTMMEHPGQGIKLVSDMRKSPGGGLYTNAELVARPSAVLPGETDRFPPVSQTLDHLEEAHRRLYLPNAETPVADKKIRKLFPKSEGYEPGQEGYKLARVAPEKSHEERNGAPGKGQGLFVHQTVGVPLHGMAGFFAHALSEQEPANRGGSKIRMDRHDSHRHLAQSIQFGTRLGGQFLAGQGAVPEAHRDAEEIRGFGALMYTQLAALTDKRRQEFEVGLVKNKTAVLSRVSLGNAVRTLSAPAQAFLSTQASAIMALFFEEYLQVHPWGDGQTLRDNVAADEVPVLEGYAHSALTGGDVRQDSAGAFGGMTELAGPDNVQGVPVFPVEMRSFGSNLTSFQNLRQDVGLLSAWSNEAHAGALAARQGHVAPFGPIGANQAPPHPQVVQQALDTAAGILRSNHALDKQLRPLVMLLQYTNTLAQQPVPAGREADWGPGLSQGAALLLDAVQSTVQGGQINSAAVRQFATQLSAEAPQLAAQIKFLLTRPPLNS
ncbi:DUF4157 domain-containing protein [Kitasatospora sp. NPDC058965]|uniref:eCIS core domain-containing protein n=1 Tax=Kitasatospora sp. NPDC058965 TaxID=3346682 RepID=UPI003686E80C